jgi:hypothetical protein
MTTFWAMALKPFLLLVFIAIAAGIRVLVIRYAPEKVKRLLLKKLW